MDSFIYKVIFRTHEQYEYKNLVLSFKNIDFEEPIIIPSKSILDLKKLSENNSHIINFQNIEEVLLIGNPTIEYSYNYYLVILYTIKSDGKKTGYLIGNVKKLGDIIIGIWPFNIDLKDITGEKILKNYNDILEYPNKFSSICIISQ
ncbi:MAG: hypothetical protein ACFE75_05575 [Candidatus Hodarchaeota archaeon]